MVLVTVFHVIFSDSTLSNRYPSFVSDRNTFALPYPCFGPLCERLQRCPPSTRALHQPLLLSPGPQVIRLINSTTLPIPFLLSPPLRRHMTEMFPRLCHPRHPMRIPIPPNSWPSRLLVEMLRFSRMQGTLGSTKPSIPTTCRFQTKGTKMGRDWRHICMLPHHFKLYVPACIAVPPDL